MLAFVFQDALDSVHVREISFEKYKICCISHHDKLFYIHLIFWFQQAVLIFHTLRQGVHCISYLPGFCYTFVNAKQLVISFWVRLLWFQEFVD